ncbi:InlB B-repeat-containing protein [Candidatus Xianfuyuplasma coldseepsis]|uniref:InlB B-repeat-containing protein n=1 Tax=Candidatus Xianfuyuplasma coldseepsis TaxID=2782163 RepID=A0A7L7KTP6_9MOLU|nr:InlB B-repeat-containing protein [Xianfuyuplasma coldseepsis]QMS85158.1 InlB B-repeat-containing protein [Xianfuyuplasma coldseepsis]
MKKFMLIIVSSMVLFLASCVPSGTFYTVTFDSKGGSEVAAIEVEEGELPEIPKDPYRIGYTFDRWYVDEDYTTRFNFFDRMEDNVTVYAKWNVNKYFIRFYDDRNNLLKFYVVEYGQDLSFVTYPIPPERNELKFASWTEQVPDIMPASDLGIYATYMEEDHLDLSYR